MQKSLFRFESNYLEEEKRMKSLMSEVQKRLFIIDQSQNENITYNVPMVLKSDGKIDIIKLKRALNALIQKHEILRTSFKFENGQYYQVIDNPYEISIEESSIYSKLDFEIESFIRPFNLSSSKLFRVKVLHMNESDFLLLDFHHIIFDGGSMRPFFNELSQLYKDEILKKQTIQYRNYTMWKNSQNELRHEKFWTDKFSDGAPVLNLYTDYTRGQYKSYKGNDFQIIIDKKIHCSIKKFCKENKISEYSFFLGAYYILLNKNSLQKEIVVGTPTAGRNHPETQNMIGMFVNTLALKMELEEGVSLSDFLKKVNSDCLESFEHQEYPFEKLYEKISFESDSSRNPIFDTMFVLQNNEMPEYMLGDLKLEMLDIKNKISKFDLTLSVEELTEEYKLSWEYCVELFKNSTISRYSEQYIEIIKELIIYPSKKLKDINITNKKELELLEKVFNNQKKSLNSQETIIDAFSKIVEKYPNKVAVKYCEEEITYQELDMKSSIIRNKLYDIGIEKEERIGLITDKSIEMIIGILGILKAGAAYLPIDPTHKTKRINYMLKDSSVKTLILGPIHSSNVKVEQFERIKEIIDFKNLRDEELEEYQKIKFNQNNLAYVIYTSGTTGNPKGVMIEHKGVVNLAKAQAEIGGYIPGDVVLQYFNYIFDGSVSEIFSALLNGCTLEMISESIRLEPRKLIKTLDNKHFQVVPSMFRAMIDFAVDNNMVEELLKFKKLYLAGETLSLDLVEKMKSLGKEKIKDIYNLYGPTENTVCATSYNLGTLKNESSIPIGKPVTGTKVTIVQNNQRCGIGIVGEICLAGIGIARGYLNLETMTKEKFILNLHDSEEIFYKTGDLGRWNENGDIEYLGRMDDQVKFRGFRIELGEIEQKLRGIECISDAIVMINNDTGNEYLAAYVLSKDEILTDQINDALSENLPDYMIPNFYLVVDKYPLTGSGKIDKKALSMMGNLSTVLDHAVEEKYDLTQKLVREIYTSVLYVEQIRLDDNFFSLGGNSLKAIQVVNSIETNFNINFNIKDVLELKTIRKVSEKIEEVLKGNVDTSYEMENMIIGEAEAL
ncbi:non-ribosomal peptide synthetase [Bacillus pseudomycoides]|uniref:non-ribosomal peptide synthetase n=1 Tax=Bacillus pseudomycoides TaxID=64104 RepID=UPI0020D1F5B2|nr:amino acid adenylation domain-containing protein [Bacillus pseudomycoides]